MTSRQRGDKTTWSCGKLYSCFYAAGACHPWVHTYVCACVCTNTYWYWSPSKFRGSFLFTNIVFSLNPVGLTFTGARNWAGTLEIKFMQLFFPFSSWWPKSPLPMTQFCHLQGGNKLHFPWRRISFWGGKPKDKKRWGDLTALVLHLEVRHEGENICSERRWQI